MSKMKEVAALLGVEIIEEFGATGINEDFRITDSRFERITLCGEWVEAPADILYDLLTGQRKIIKKPWKPKKGEWYWCATTCGISSIGGAAPREWNDKMLDLAYYAIGNCFRTEKEAHAHKKELLARLQKIYADGKPLIGEDEWRDKE